MEYIAKKDKIKQVARELFEKRIIKKVREYLKNDFGKRKWIFEVFLVGSAKRNLILVGNEGFDLDYQLIFNKMPADYKENAKKTKLKFKEYFDNAFKELKLDLTNCEDSTHVLTTKKLDEKRKVTYSYDIAILRYNEKQNYCILKNEKRGKNDDYHYIELSNCEKFNERYKLISTSKKWKQLRKVYKSMKEEVQNLCKDDRPHSFSLLGEAVNEVLQKS
jgi:Nucleotidyltransferase domain.